MIPKVMSHTKEKRTASFVLALAPMLAGTMPLAGQTPVTLRQAAAARAIPIGAAASADEYGPPDLLLNPSYAGLLSTNTACWSRATP
jgi:hypothetical protein